jgi:hypothetical protein
LTCKFRRDLNQSLGNQHSDRIQIAGVGFEAESLGFQRNRAAAGERVVQAGHLLRVEEFLRQRMALVQLAGLPPRLANFDAGLLQYCLVRGVFPLYEFFDDDEKPGAGLGPVTFLLLIRLPAWVLASPQVFGIVHKLGEDDGSRRGKRPARPPEMQGGGVPVADRLLPRRRDVNGVERQGDFDQLFRRDHGLSHVLSFCR